MRSVFVLGAGFSKQIHSSMPLLSELSEDILQRVQDLPQPLLKLGNNVELWLTYLSQPHPWLLEEHNLENRASFLRLTRHIGQVLDERTDKALGQNCPPWLTSLTKWWHDNKAVVITFNYDTLVERAAGMIPVSPPDKGGSHPLRPENIYSVTITDITRRNATVLGEGDVSSFRLCKLHGSVNWYYSGAATFYGEVLYYSDVVPWGVTRDRESQSKLDASDKVPLIVPPTTEKSSYFQHETIKRVWAVAAEALQGASSVYCLGYSLPETDLGIRFFLHHSAPQTPAPLYVVNTDLCASQRYQLLLGESYNISDKYIGPDAIKAMVGDLPH